MEDKETADNNDEVTAAGDNRGGRRQRWSQKLVVDYREDKRKERVFLNRKELGFNLELGLKIRLGPLFILRNLPRKAHLH
ncbi:hypothetical protein TanjilG_18130 [Lupinus angustifolius]|uniref:Uncharacterized protein n=1 Tax=Lupinus angustifolius TaxID=3871 RepID=A0A1J7IEU3_LUPAN|nr:hypothetical protein TanjilG_18130 [Lupinus angustifolius]